MIGAGSKLLERSRASSVKTSTCQPFLLGPIRDHFTTASGAPNPLFTYLNPTMMLALFPHVCLTLLVTLLPAVWGQVPSTSGEFLLRTLSRFFGYSSSLPRISLSSIFYDQHSDHGHSLARWVHQLVQWTIAKEDLSTFDIGMARFASPGLHMVAHNGECTPIWIPVPLSSAILFSGTCLCPYACYPDSVSLLDAFRFHYFLCRCPH